MTARTADDAGPGNRHDVRLDGDPGSCRSAAAVLRAGVADVRRRPPPGGVPSAALAAAATLSAALDRYGQELRQAQVGHATATRPVERNAALALTARARRRLRLVCADILADRGLP